MRALTFALSLIAMPVLAGTAEPSIGTATMRPDGTIVMTLVSLPPGPIAHAQITVKPTDRTYKETLDHIGGLKPGETKSVPPWPDEPVKTEHQL